MPGVGELRVAVGRAVQQLTFHQRSEAETAPVVGHDRTVLRFETLARHPQTGSRRADQERARLCRGVANRRAAVLHGMAARGVTLVGRERCDMWRCQLCRHASYKSLSFSVVAGHGHITRMLGGFSHLLQSSGFRRKACVVAFKAK